MSFRKSPHLGSTEYAPFELLFGQVMRLPFDASLQPKDNLQRDAKQYMKDLLKLPRQMTYTTSPKTKIIMINMSDCLILQ